LHALEFFLLEKTDRCPIDKNTLGKNS